MPFHRLDPSQRDLLDGSLRDDAPRFLTGRAGSSKSTLLHHQFARYAALAIDHDDGYQPRFVTRSQHLLDDARRRVSAILLEEHGYAILGPERVGPVAGWMSTTSALLRQLVLAAGGNHDEWRLTDHISTARFRDLYLGRKQSGAALGDDEVRQFRDHHTRRRLHWTTAWFVIRALIRGYDPAGELDAEGYDELPSRDRSVASPTFCEIYERVYDAWYAPLLHDGSLWDDQQLAREAVRAPHNDLRISAIVCDEAQDLSRIELLALLGASELLRYDLGRGPLPCLPFVFAGDESQALDLTGFRWASITSGFYELTGAAFGGAASYTIDDDQLEVNYRSAYEIVAVANAIQQQRKRRFGEAEARSQRAHLQPNGAPIRLVDQDTADRRALLDTLSLNEVILPCEEGAEHDVVVSDPLLHAALRERDPYWVERGEGVAPVYTAQALKGLELDTAVLYGWGDALRADEDRPELAKRAEHARWYVAVTRARRGLTVVESAQGRQLWDELDLPAAVLAEHELEVIKDGVARRRELAEGALDRGMAARKPEELLRAATGFDELGDHDAATRARAFAARFEGDRGVAARLFLELGDQDEAVEELWAARSWEALADLDPGKDPVAVARLLTAPTDPTAVQAGVQALSRCHARAEAIGEPLDLVEELGSVAERAVRHDWSTTAKLLDALADEPQLGRGRRGGLAELIARATAVELDLPSLAKRLAEHDAAARLRLGRWIVRQGNFTHEDTAAFLEALRTEAPDLADSLADELGLATAPRAIADEPTGSPSLPEDAATLVPGQPCDILRGEERWRLSPQRGGSLVRKDDEVDLAAVVGSERAGRFVATALRVRPSGGAVWVDANGVATTLVDGRLVYLGGLPRRDDQIGLASTKRPLSERPSASGAVPAAATPVGSLPEIDGWPPGSRRYTLRRRDITDPVADRSLSDVVGPKVAAEEARRLLTHRPTGGRIYVAPDGRVVTRVDDRFLVIGEIRPDRWFPS